MITFDPINKRIVLDSVSITWTEIYSRWVDWAGLSDNAKYGMVIRQVGSDDLGSGLSIPPYYFLQGAWRIRPMEIDHDLTLTGNGFVEGGGTPVVRTLGPYQVSVNYTVAVQAQGISTSGSSGPSAAEIAAAILAAAQITPIHADVRKSQGVEIVESTSPTASEVANAVSQHPKTLTISKFIGLK